MFHAIAAGKANVRQIVDGPKQPREDLVTSALFGTMEFLTASGRCRALETVVNWTGTNNPDVHLWPRFARGSGWVEPDVVISHLHGGKRLFLLVEVKWGATLGPKQALSEIKGVQSANCLRGAAALRFAPPRELTGYVLLGKEPHHEPGLVDLGAWAGPVHAVPWHEVTARLRCLIALANRSPTDHGLLRWAIAAESFLAATSKGRRLSRWQNMETVGAACYKFDKGRRIFRDGEMLWPGAGIYSFEWN